jgi:hypothetical protein
MLGHGAKVLELRAVEVLSAAGGCGQSPPKASPNLPKVSEASREREPTPWIPWERIVMPWEQRKPPRSPPQPTPAPFTGHPLIRACVAVVRLANDHANRGHHGRPGRPLADHRALVLSVRNAPAHRVCAVRDASRVRPMSAADWQTRHAPICWGCCLPLTTAAEQAVNTHEGCSVTEGPTETPHNEREK